MLRPILTCKTLLTEKLIAVKILVTGVEETLPPSLVYAALLICKRTIDNNWCCWVDFNDFRTHFFL